MNMVKRNYFEAKSFYRRNIWLTVFCVIGLISTTVITFFNGLGGICYNISLISMLLGFIMFFRLGCNKRHLFDIEDMFSCLLHVFNMDLHYYLSANDFYEISRGRKCANFFIRLLLGGMFIVLVVVFMPLSEELILDRPVLHPVLAVIWIGLSAVANLAISAFLERQYNKFYGVEKPFNCN